MKKFNSEILLKILILLGFISFFLIIIFTKKIKLYVHPRIIPFVIIGVIIMVIFVILDFKNITIAGKRKFKFTPYIIFIIPIIIAFSINIKTVNLSSLIKNNDISIQKNTGNKIENNNNKTKANSVQQYSQLEKKDLNIQNGIIEIDSNFFISSINEINKNLDKYQGKHVKIIGFVYKNNKFSNDEFVIGRFMMVCCTADMQLVGFMCKYKNTNTLKNDMWLEVDGIINKTITNGQDMALISVDSTSMIKVPQDPYVYPY